MTAAGTLQLSAVARGGALNLVGAGLSSFAGIAVLVLLTRGLGATVAGTVFAATSVFLVLEMLGRLGTDVSLLYFISRQRALTGQVAPATLGIALRSVGLASTALAVGLFAAAAPIASWFVSDGSPSATTYLRALAFFLPPASLSAVLLGATRGLGNMRPTVVIDRLGRSLGQLVLVLLAVACTSSGTWAVFGWSASYVPAAVLSGLWLRRLLRPQDGQSGAVEALPAKVFWQFTAPRAAASVAQVVLQRLDIVLVAALLGPAEAAVYAAATRFLVVGQLGVQALSFAVQPQMSAALALRDVSSARALYQVSTGWLILLVWPMFLTAAVLAPLVLHVFGPGFTSGISVMTVLALTMLVATGCGFVDIVLILSGQTNWSLFNTVLALIVDVVLDLILIPHIGIVGAALGWAAAILINNLLPLAQVIHFVGVHPAGRATLTAALLASVCFGLLPAAVRLGTDSVLAAMVATGVMVVVYALAVWRERAHLQLHVLHPRFATTR